MLDFIWIYIHGPSDYAKTGRFYELDYSIKSVKKFYNGKCRCIVIGDDPELDVIHVPVDRIETSSKGYYRHFDQIKKLLAAIEVAGDEMVLMYDDIYLVNPVSKKDIQQVYAKCSIFDINEYFNSRKGDNAYKRCWLNTMKRISEFRSDLYDWETHLPRYMKTKNLAKIIRNFNLENVDYLSYSLYAAMYGGIPRIVDNTVQGEVLEYTPLHTDWENVFSAKYLNTADNGISQEFINKMKELFD